MGKDVCFLWKILVKQMLLDTEQIWKSVFTTSNETLCRYEIALCAVSFLFLLPVTDNCSCWINGRGRMAVEMFSWPSLLERMCRTCSGDQTRGRLHAKRTRFRSRYRPSRICLYAYLLYTTRMTFQGRSIVSINTKSLESMSGINTMKPKPTQKDITTMNAPNTWKQRTTWENLF